MKRFAPILLLGVNAGSKRNNPDLLQNLFMANEGKYLHLLGMDEDREMSHHANHAMSDIKEVYLSMSQREDDFGLPIYDVTRGLPVPHSDRKR